MVTVIQPRIVPLGGIRAMPVRRTLPHRELSLIGAWCFLDQFNSDGQTPMEVLPHPHTALQTVTWPIVGEIHHRDSLDSDVRVRPGELNLMTAGHGVSHSEFSSAGEPLHGVQLWLALPTGPDTGEPLFEQVTDLPTLTGDGWDFTVFIGELDGVRSPATVFSPLVGADGRIAPGTRVQIPFKPEWEYGILVFSGSVELAVDNYITDPAAADGIDPDVEAGRIPEGHLAYLGLGDSELSFTAGPDGARVILIGGEPFREPVVMFWNFIGRDHDQVAEAAAAWENDWRGQERRFGLVEGHGDEHIPGPSLPPVRLKARRSPHLG